MAKKSPFLVWTPQFWSKDPKKPLHYGALIGELITLKDTPPILNRFGSRAPTPRKKNTSWPISPLYSIHIYNKKVLTKTKCLKHISNGGLPGSVRAATLRIQGLLLWHFFIFNIHFLAVLRSNLLRETYILQKGLSWGGWV